MAVRPLVAALTFVCIAAGVGALVSLACGGGTPTPMQRCCESATGKTVRDACLAGEVGLPLDRCAPPDAGMSCGDGTFNPATEQCDPSASKGCQPPKTCVNCQCADACGDGTKSPTEQCELNGDCTGQGVVCRKCLCVFSQTAYEVTDPIDLPAAAAGAFDIRSLSVTIDGPPKEAFNIDVVPGSGQNADPPIALCVVLMESGAEAARLCYDVVPADRVVHYTDINGVRTLSPTEVTVLIGGAGSGPFLQVAANLMLIRPTVSFHVESLRGGQVVDRLPDTGEIPYTDIIGK